MPWIPLFVMPNLRVKEPVSVRQAAIVGPDDERVRAYGRQYPQFKRFITKYRGPFGAKCEPGIFLMQIRIRKSFRTIEAMSSFRDLVAMSVIPLQRARSMTQGGSFYTQYSDYFDFYPWTYNDRNGHLVCSSPALVGLDEVRSFRGQSSPVLSPQDLDSADLDRPLLNQLLLRWQRRYSTTRPEWADLALFRSLNMAFAASKIPAGIDMTQFHVGRSIALWVSAFEILSHSGTDVRLFDVYERVAALPWKERATRHKRFKPYKWKKKGPLPCWIYGEIHHARNDFLHGNPVDRKRLIVRKSKRNLFSYAAPLYRMALAGFLPIPVPPRSEPGSFSRDGYDFIMNQNYVEEALSTILVTEKRHREIRRERLSRVKVTWRRGGQRTLPEHI